jgi:hypothetical protein
LAQEIQALLHNGAMHFGHPLPDDGRTAEIRLSGIRLSTDGWL